MAMEYTTCLKQGQILQELSADYARLYGEIVQFSEGSAAFWSGAANTTFRNEIETWRKEAFSIKNTMEALGEDIVDVTNQMREKEEAAAALLL